MPSKKITCLLFGAALLMSVGCGGESIPNLAEVSGTVVANGEPVPQVGVFFMPDPETETFQPGSQPSQAVTDENGKFTLKYDGPDTPNGAAIGMHRVRLTDVLYEESRENPIPIRLTQVLMNAGTTPIKVEVKKEGNADVTIDITDYMTGD